MRKTASALFIALFMLSAACSSGDSGVSQVGSDSSDSDKESDETPRDEGREDEIRAALSAGGSSTPLPSEIECLAKELPEGTDLEAFGSAFGADTSLAAPVVADAALVTVIDTCVEMGPMSEAFVEGLAEGLEVQLADGESECMNGAIDDNVAGAGAFLKIVVDQDLTGDIGPALGDCLEDETISTLFNTILVGSAGLTETQADCVFTEMTEKYSGGETFSLMLNQDDTFGTELQTWAAGCV